MTQCPKCGGPGVVLFTSIACEACDQPQGPIGWVVWDCVSGNIPPGKAFRGVVVFRDRENAERYAAWGNAYLAPRYFRVTLLGPVVWATEPLGGGSVVYTYRTLYTAPLRPPAGAMDAAELLP